LHKHTGADQDRNIYYQTFSNIADWELEKWEVLKAVKIVKKTSPGHPKAQ